MCPYSVLAVSGQVIEAVWRGTINFQTIYIPGIVSLHALGSLDIQLLYHLTRLCWKTTEFYEMMEEKQFETLHLK